jgi:hypothetical protein
LNRIHHKGKSDDVCWLFKVDMISKDLEYFKKVDNSINKHLSTELLQYIYINRENIDYATYLSKGYFIGEEAQEISNLASVCRKLQNYHSTWAAEKAQGFISLIAKISSNKWESEVVPAVYAHYSQPVPIPVPVGFPRV